MKRYTKKLFATILTVFALLSFTSCEEDYRWVEGTIDYPANITVAPSRDLHYDIQIDESWIVTRGVGRYPDIRDVQFVRGQIDIYIDKNRYIDWLDLTVDGTNVTLPFDGLAGNITDASSDAQRFLAVVTDRIRRYGYAVILVDGEGDSGTRVGIDFGMDLEVYVRD